MKINKKAVVLLSGGLDSAVTLDIARIREGFDCRCLIFDYGQRHKKEIIAAKKVAEAAGCPYTLLKIKLPWGGSSLLDKEMGVSSRDNQITRQRANAIPSTYVPARNIIFLSYALSYAEAIGAGAVFIGAHAQDYSGYPDCRPLFLRAFSKAAARGTKCGSEGSGIRIKAPLLNKTKSGIIALGLKLKTDFALTRSCYNAGKYPCGKCDSCYYREKGFREAKAIDPALPASLRKGKQ